jgi:hypothetical protein
MESSRPTSLECGCLYFSVLIIAEWGRKDYLLGSKKLIRKIIPVVLSKMRAAGFLMIKCLMLICIIGFAFHNAFAAEYIVPKKPASVEVTDIDLDGDLDIVLACNSDTLVIMFNDGDGNFDINYYIPFHYYGKEIRAGIINSDAFPDITTQYSDYSNLYIAIFMNNGQGIFTLDNYYQVNDDIDYLELYNSEDNNNLDIIFASHLGQFMGLLYNDGTGQFSPPTYYNVNYHPTGLACDDLNGNGREDILVSNVGNLDAWFSTDSGLVYTNISDTARAYQVKIADVDNDGDNDIVGYDWGIPGTPKKLLIYFNDGSGNFSLSYSKWISEAMAELFVSDLNNDSFPDIIYNVSIYYPNSQYELFHTYILFNNQNGTFHDPVNYYTGICSHKSYAADLDGNGWNDIITLNYDFYNPPPDTGTIHILFNDGNGNFVEDPIVGVKKKEPPITSGYKLYQNYPNPFNSTTLISYYLERTAPIELSIYTINGQLIKTITHEQQKGGSHSVRWDATNNNGKKVSSGVYLYSLRVDNEVITRKMLLIR